MEQQVCTIAQAKRLQELGVSQDSVFMWCCIMPDPLGEKSYFEPVYKHEVIDTLHEQLGAAFTVAELGVMLAHGTGMCKYNHGKWKAEYEHDTTIPECRNKGTGTTHYLVHCKTEAEARAAFLIYSIENGFLKIEEVNQRLSA
jgi:hypothetical protein